MKLCSCCHTRPARKHQRTCQPCHTAYVREHRKKQKKDLVKYKQLAALVPVLLKHAIRAKKYQADQTSNFNYEGEK